MNRKIDTWLPVLLFTLVGLSIFLTEKSDGGSIEGSLFGQTSAHGLTLSKNLTNSEHPLFMFSSRELKEGRIVYEAYNRFPVFPFLITGLLIDPFEGNLNFQIYIARQIMNIFFFLSIIVAFKFINELTKNKYLSISVVLIGFSSYYLLSFNNIIFNDIPALLGFILALHCVVIAQKQKLKKLQLLFYSLIPISLGWQPYAVFAAWLLIDALEIFFEKKTSFGIKISSIIKRPSMIVMTLAVFWGILILSLQLLNEWRIIGGAFTDLPSVSSGLWRSGLTSAAGRTSLLWTYDWLTYIPAQFRVMTLMLIPFWPVFQVEPGINASVFIVIVLLIIFIVRYFKDRSILNKSYLILILSGFLWSIPMRHFVALHDFQAIFYIGFVLSVFILLLTKIKLQAWNLLAINVTLAFLISVSLSNYYKTPNSGLITNQFKTISDQLPANSKVYLDAERHRVAGFSKFAIDLYLVGHVFAPQNNAEYVITKDPEFNGKKLTSNSGFNLFKVSDEIKTSIKNY